MKKTVLLSLFAAAYCIVLFLGLVVRADTLGRVYRSVGIVNDNYLHFFSFFFLALILYVLFTYTLLKRRWPVVWAFSLSVVIAACAEVFQAFIPTRHPMWVDFWLHVAGALSFCLIILFSRFLKKAFS